jgi:hypothetical protein
LIFSQSRQTEKMILFKFHLPQFCSPRQYFKLPLWALRLASSFPQQVLQLLLAQFPPALFIDLEKLQLKPGFLPFILQQK